MTTDLKTLTDRQFYGEEYMSNGRFNKAVHSAENAASKVWAEVLDNTKDESRKPQYGGANYFDASDFGDIKAGDLLAVANIDLGRNRYATRPSSASDTSLAEWVGRTYSPPSLYVVVRRTAKRITVFSVDNPAGHFDRDFSLDREQSQIDYWAEAWGDSSSRFLVNLGNRDALVEQVQASQSYARWERAKAAAVAAMKEHDCRFEAKRKAEKAREAAAVAPFKPVAKRLNQALGEKVFVYGESGVSRHRGWESVPTSFLKKAVTVADLGKDEAVEVLRLLDEHAVV